LPVPFASAEAKAAAALAASGAVPAAATITQAARAVFARAQADPFGGASIRRTDV
jgi:hypothetical protein